MSDEFDPPAFNNPWIDLDLMIIGRYRLGKTLTGTHLKADCDKFPARFFCRRRGYILQGGRDVVAAFDPERIDISQCFLKTTAEGPLEVWILIDDHVESFSDLEIPSGLN